MSLQKHINDKHGEKPNCQICHVGFWNQDAFIKHINEEHNKSPANQKISYETVSMMRWRGSIHDHMVRIPS